MSPKNPRAAAVIVTLVSSLVLAACGGGSANDSTSANSPPKGGEVHLTIGYQSKTINTVTAGTLLRNLGFLERRLGELTKETGTTYTVSWEDYPSGPPITAQMVAGKVDIASMGDYPLLVNGSKTQSLPDAHSAMVAVTGYNLRGSLNAVVVPPASKAKSLEDLGGQQVSATFGSAGHGMVIKALSDMGKGPDFMNLVNQQPEVGASALQGGQVAALSQFVPWPQLMVFRGQARMLFDGGDTGRPTSHGVVARRQYASAHPEVVETFLSSVMEASDYIHERPLDAAQIVAKETGLEPEVVYLYNGPNGIVTFDLTLKPQLVDALKSNIPFLKSLDTNTDLDVAKFVDDSYLRKAYGPSYDKDLSSVVNKAALSGNDAACGSEITDPTTASEAWFEGQTTTKAASTPTCLLRMVKAAEAAGSKLRVAYVPDARTTTRSFARTDTWVEDGAADPTARLLPFATVGDAETYSAAHPGSRVIDYGTALAAA